MNYSLDVDIMTRDSGDTDLEPSEEFPILFGLLTAPVSTTSNGGPGVKPYFTVKRPDAEAYQFEPDSSAMSDDDGNSSLDDDDSSSYTSSQSEDEDESCESDEDDDELLSSKSQTNTLNSDNDPDNFPTSTTLDDEDYDDMIFHYHQHHQQARAAGNVLARSNRPLKRTYRQMSCSHESSSKCGAAPLVKDTQDVQMKQYCFTPDGLEKLKMFQLNRMGIATLGKSAHNNNLGCLQNTQQVKNSLDPDSTRIFPPSSNTNNTDNCPACKSHGINDSRTNKKFSDGNRRKRTLSYETWLEIVTQQQRLSSSSSSTNPSNDKRKGREETTASSIKHFKNNITNESFNITNNNSVVHNNNNHNNSRENTSNTIRDHVPTKDKPNANKRENYLNPAPSIATSNPTLPQAGAEEESSEQQKLNNNTDKYCYCYNQESQTYKCPHCDLIVVEENFVSHLTNCQEAVNQ